MSVSTDNIDSPSQRIKTQGCVLREVLFRQFKGLATGLPVVIPSYQRAYCWSMDDIQKVFDDIDSLRLTDDRYEETDYYLGSIAFQKALGDAKKDGKQQADHLLLLDGQQRLTSLILWINALHETLTQHDPNGEQISDPTRQILEELCSEPTSAFEYKQPKSYRHMVEIYQILKGDYAVLYAEGEHLNQLLNRQDVSPLSLWESRINEDLERLRYMLDHALFAVTIFNSPYEATQYFMGENHRGVPMSLVDKVKSYHLRFVPDRKSERTRVYEIWQWMLNNGQSTKSKRQGELLEDYVLPMLLFLLDRLPNESDYWQRPSLFDYLKGFQGSIKHDRWIDHKACLLGRLSADVTGDLSDDAIDAMRTQLNSRSLDLRAEFTQGTPFFVGLLYVTVLLKAVQAVIPLPERSVYKQYSRTSERMVRRLIHFALVFWADCYIKIQRSSVADKVVVGLNDLADLGKYAAFNDWEKAVNDTVSAVAAVLREDSGFYRYYVLWRQAAITLRETHDNLQRVTIGNWCVMTPMVTSPLSIPYRHADPSKAYRALLHFFTYDVKDSDRELYQTRWKANLMAKTQSKATQIEGIAL